MGQYVCSLCQRPYLLNGSAEGTMVKCPSCGGWTQAATMPAGPAAPGVIVAATPKVNGFSVAALISALTCIGGLLGIIFGIIALVQISGSRGQQKGRGLAIAGMILGVLIPLLPILLIVPTIGEAQKLANRSFCTMRLAILGQAIENYADNNAGRFPPDLAALSTAGNAERRYCYRYVPDRKGNGMLILIHDRKDNHPDRSRCCFFVNGRVEFFSEEAFRAAVAEDNRLRKNAALPQIPPDPLSNSVHPSKKPSNSPP